MAAFLWVEDFDGGTYRTTTDDVFGKLAGKFGDIPDDKDDLQDYLTAKNIYLETNLTDALRFIADKDQLAKIDYVVLDIDLKIADDPEDESANQDLLAEVFKWYEGLPEVEQRIALKKVAGYHLWTRLVIDGGFPRDRIQFCSQHGNYLNSIKESFGTAKIVSPEVFRKGDGQASEWIARQARDPYTSLRRNVIDYCAAITSHLLLLTDDSPKMLRLAEFPGKTAMDFTRYHALEMLEMLPRHLPPLVPNENLPDILRAFGRSMTMEWDRFDVSPKMREEFLARTGTAYNDAIDFSMQSGASVLKLLRNTLSHATGKPTPFDCPATAMLFVLNMNVIYCLDDVSGIEKLENNLLPAPSQSNDAEIDELLQRTLQQEASIVRDLARWADINPNSETTGKARRVGDLLRQLQFKSSAEYQRDAVKWLFQMLWHELTYGAEAPRKFASRVASIRTGSNPVHRVAMACLDRAF